MLVRLLILALCCTFLSCKDLVNKYKRSSSGVSELDKAVLYDFRPGSVPILKSVDRASQQFVLGAIPPPSCPVAANQPAVQAKIVSALDGSFSYAAETETAYLVTGPCAGQNHVVVVSSGKVQASSETPYSAVIGSYDLNHDDQNELLLAGETTHEGVVTRETSLQKFEKNSLRAFENFGIVSTDPCSLFAGASETKKQELIAKGISPHLEAVRILYLPRPNHEMPSFTAERYRAACPTTPGGPQGPWQMVSGK